MNILGVTSHAARRTCPQEPPGAKDTPAARARAEADGRRERSLGAEGKTRCVRPQARLFPDRGRERVGSPGHAAPCAGRRASAPCPVKGVDLQELHAWRGAPDFEVECFKYSGSRIPGGNICRRSTEINTCGPTDADGRVRPTGAGEPYNRREHPASQLGGPRRGARVPRACTPHFEHEGA